MLESPTASSQRIYLFSLFSFYKFGTRELDRSEVEEDDAQR